jgi:hypothetical protein
MSEDFSDNGFRISTLQKENPSRFLSATSFINHPI